jgi:hypothetical protein
VATETQRARVALSALSLGAAVWAVTASKAVFPELGIDSDEGVYLLQADALRHGHLFPPAHAPGAAFLPWLSVLQHGHYVTKYTPVHASLVALGTTLFRSERGALGLIAGGTVVVTYLLARAVLLPRRDALFASAAMALAPLFLVQTATYLPYASNVLLLGAFAAALAGAPRRRGPRVGLAGAAWGLALFARPFDAVLFGAPLIVWFVVARGASPLDRPARVAWFAGGAAPPTAAMLLYFRLATGSALRPPFSLLDPLDAVGFGARRMIPFEAPLDYGLGLGWRAFATHGLLLGFWVFGGLLLIVLAVAGLRGTSRSSPLVPLAATALSVPVGYVLFWGTYNALSWGAPFSLGPYYWMPVLLPLAVLGARGHRLLADREACVARAAVIGMVVLSAAVTAGALRTGHHYSESDQRVWATLRAAHLTRAVVFLPERQLGHPFQQARNRDGFDGEVVWALDRGDCGNAEVLEALPPRRAYRLAIRGHYRARPPDPAFEVVLRPYTPACSTGEAAARSMQPGYVAPAWGTI